MSTYRVYYVYEDEDWVDVEADSAEEAESRAHDDAMDTISFVTDVREL